MMVLLLSCAVVVVVVEVGRHSLFCKINVSIIKKEKGKNVPEAHLKPLLLPPLHGITLCAIEDIQPPVEIFLILTQVNINGMEDMSHSNVAMK